ncbi:MAG: type II toxin-antitoxin system VapC family toxin [Chloroflexi bacterium]|nr:type II toxin-antitoxin system VapC family toxin [Chloroflexota bacterium]
MASVLVDGNVLLDVLQEDPNWGDWSSDTLGRLGRSSVLVMNPIIYAEISVSFTSIEDLDSALPATLIERAPLPYQAGFLAGKAYVAYRQRGGVRTAPLPDFFIGAHAAIAGYRLLTRDAARYRTYFPTLDVIAPD